MELVVKEHEFAPTMEKLEALFQRYKFWETKLIRSKQGLSQKIPDVKRTIDVVKTLQKRGGAEEGEKATSTEPIEAKFELADQIYVRAKIPKTTSVSLWLGVRLPPHPIFHYRANKPKKEEQITSLPLRPAAEDENISLSSFLPSPPNKSSLDLIGQRHGRIPL